MIRIINESEILIEMATLAGRRTGLKADIWSDQNGVKRNKKDKKNRIKITYNNAEVSISIEENPEILAQTKGIKRSEWKAIKDAMKYVGRNYDLFLNHYNSTPAEYDDDDLKNDLRERGEYK